MHFPHDNQGQTQPIRPDAHFFCLGARIESFKNWQGYLKVSENLTQNKSEGSAPGYEVPRLPELTEKQGSVRYIWWTSAEPKLAVSVTSVTNKVNSFFWGNVAFNFPVFPVTRTVAIPISHAATIP